MVNNKSKGKQQQSQWKKGVKTQQQPQQGAGANESKVVNVPKSKDKLPQPSKPLSDTVKTQKLDRTSSINTSLKRLNISNKKTSKASASTSTAKPNQISATTTTPRITSRDEDHKDDPMGHKKNQFGKMRLNNSSMNGQTITNYATVSTPCAKCSPQSNGTNYNLIGSLIFTGKQFRKQSTKYGNSKGGNNYRNEPRNVIMNSTFVPIAQPRKPVLSSSNIAAVIADTDKLTIFEKLGKGRTLYPIMQVCAPKIS